MRVRLQASGLFARRRAALSLRTGAGGALRSRMGHLSIGEESATWKGKRASLVKSGGSRGAPGRPAWGSSCFVRTTGARAQQ